MKHILCWLALLLLAAVACAQSAVIGYPPNGYTVSPGASLTVQIQCPNSLTGSEEVAIVIGFQSCRTNGCISPSSFMGQILYNGPFEPQYHEPMTPLYENFTVQVPSSAATGTALIGVVHVTLIGASYYPYMEVLNTTLTVS
ncbi:hypothetical protein SCLCIDRAFT_142655 [Scleroderma citrinum Foug A]|uniref:Phosphatidylglycerol/phosphatidylinositol transfer protein n=1 Tax=Scleroderma citrinum Foug A TaxID=1036808 RepID=A0A0C3D5M9_9AGAM|nr:hypothetical protein SCLCIDRAFT_142655 [Scleroderma citrinum Foug A]